MSQYALKLYNREQSKIYREDCRQDLEKLLLINLHESFSKFKANFIEALSMIESYINKEDEAPPIFATFESIKVIARLSHGPACMNLE